MVDINKLKSASQLTGKLKEIFSEEELIEMAKQGLCPHYVIRNPLNNTEGIYFIQTEITDWINDNLLKQKRYKIEQNIVLHYVDYEHHKIAETDVVPSELTRVNGLLKLPLCMINTPPGIYFLCKGPQIVYIGKAKNVYSRILNHINEEKKDFNQVYFISCHVNNLTTFERALIRYYRPPLNHDSDEMLNEKDQLTLDNLFGSSPIAMAVNQISDVVEKETNNLL